jgi:hypothetical protein
MTDNLIDAEKEEALKALHALYGVLVRGMTVQIRRSCGQHEVNVFRYGDSWHQISFGITLVEALNKGAKAFEQSPRPMTPDPASTGDEP